MTRLLMKLLGREYEPCKSCELLKEQLNYERAEKQELLLTLTSLVKPQVIVHDDKAEPKPITPRFTMFSRRRAELERLDRENAKIQANSPVIARSDNKIDKSTDESIEKLEHELGVSDEEEKVN